MPLIMRFDIRGIKGVLDRMFFGRLENIQYFHHFAAI